MSKRGPRIGPLSRPSGACGRGFIQFLIRLTGFETKYPFSYVARTAAAVGMNAAFFSLLWQSRPRSPESPDGLAPASLSAAALLLLSTIMSFKSN